MFLIMNRRDKLKIAIILICFIYGLFIASFVAIKHYIPYTNPFAIITTLVFVLFLLGMFILFKTKRLKF